MLHAKGVWAALLCAAECVAGHVGDDADHAVEDAVEAELVRYPSLTSEEATLARHCAFNLARFSALCSGAFQGYRACYKRNGGYKAPMYLVAYLLIFQYRTLGGSTVREMLEGCMPTLRLCEFVEFLLNAEAVAAHAVPLWRAVYDDPFLQRHVLSALSAIASEATHDVVEWFRGQPTLSAAPAEDTQPTPPAAARSTLRPASTTTLPPPALRRLPGARLPPQEVREMAFTVPEPRLPRIKGTPAAAPAASTKLPTVAVGFSFHQREAAVAAAKTTEAATVAPAVQSTTSDLGPRPTPEQLRAMLDNSRGVPTTVTALWRETCVRERQRENAQKALQNLEVAVHDASAYELWRQAQREDEERQREMAAVQRHLDAVEAKDRVRAQRERTTQARRRRIQKMKTQNHAELAVHKREHKQALVDQEQHVQQQRRQLARECAAALGRSAAEKSALAAQVRDEADALRVEAQEAAELRHTRQVLVIQEIHLLRQRLRERQAAMGAERRQAWADGVADAALGRMSPAELRDALVRLRAEVAAEEEERRQHVQSTRSRALTERERLERECLQAREVQRQTREAKQAQRAAHKAAVEAERVEKEAARMAQLHEKLEVRRQAKREAHRSAHEVERQRRNEVLLRSQDGASMERKRWAQYDAGLARRAEAEQQRVLKEALQSA